MSYDEALDLLLADDPLPLDGLLAAANVDVEPWLAKIICHTISLRVAAEIGGAL